MIHRFQDPRILLGSLRTQKLIQGNESLAKALVEKGELLQVDQGHELITEGASDNRIFLILAGSFNIHVKGKLVANRKTGDHIGEMTAIDPSQLRTTTAIAAEPSVVFVLLEPEFAALSEVFPVLWKNVAVELGKRLIQRNSTVDAVNSQPKVFIISSVEALPIAQELQSALSHDKFLVTLWTDGVFWASYYALERLEEVVMESDFAIAIAQGDDARQSRGTEHLAPRDNVIFELGLFMGRLGRKRTILVEPRGEEVKLPSDLAGLTAIGYKVGLAADLPALLAPTCHEIRKIIQKLGPR